MLTFAATAYALQQTMVVPALPELQRELDASTTWVTSTMTTGFLLAAAVLTPILGKLGDRFGKERLLVYSLVELRRTSAGNMRRCRDESPKGRVPAIHSLNCALHTGDRGSFSQLMPARGAGGDGR